MMFQESRTAGTARPGAPELHRGCVRPGAHGV